MKKVLFMISFLLIGISAQAQKKNAKAVIEVDGVCMMCKKRIEKAALTTKGVKFAVWDVKTKKLSLIFDERKVQTSQIEKNIAAVGHDTKNVKATEKAYQSVDKCCKYRDPKVVEDHNTGGEK